MFCFGGFFSVETARIQKESAEIDGKLEEHSRTRSELRRLQVNIHSDPTPVVNQHSISVSLNNSTSI